MLCPVGTVKSRIAKARDEIAQKLRRRGFTGVRT
jgi:DNA-directed RNA polymerase specialized sigma24 family protein